MHSTEKGEIFEARVYDILLLALAQDKLFIPAHRSLLFKKQPYFSKDREKDIIFDLAIETYREGGMSPNLITLIECKDLGRAISIDDVQELYSKKEQVARANSKCLLVTTTNLQESAFKYATNVGMAVVRILDDDSMTWLIERANKNFTTSPVNTTIINVINALTNEYYVSAYNNTFAFYNDKPYLSIDDLLLALLQENLQKNSG